MYFHKPLVPKNGRKLVVGIVARISGCASQKELSLDDQIDHAKEVIGNMFDGEVEYRRIATKGKGEALDRPELKQIEEMLRTGEIDVLIMEDVGRLIRGGAAVRLWGLAVDHGTRCIAPNDYVDTENERWEEELLSACRDHVSHQSNTSQRLKNKSMNRFKKYGGSVALPPAGYLKPIGAKTYDDWVKDDSAEAAKLPNGEWTIVEGAQRLKNSLNCSEIADWFNQIGFRPGKYCRNDEWDGKMVRRLYQNPILKGFPARGFKHTAKHHQTGRRRSVKKPEGPEFYECPHLGYLEPAEFDELNYLLERKNQSRGRKPRNGRDPLKDVPRKRTRFPGQHARCFYCGHLCVWGGNGMVDHLMCSNSRRWRCWNSVGFDGGLLTENLSTHILDMLEQLDGFDTQYRSIVDEALGSGCDDLMKREKSLARRESDHQRAWANMMEAIKEYGPLEQFKAELDLLKQQEAEIKFEKTKLQSIAQRQLELPPSIDQLRELILEEMNELAIDSPEYGHLMRKLVPEISVYLVRLCDGGHLHPRARVKLDLLGSIDDAALVPSVKESLSRVINFNLFEPPQRERIRVDATCLRSKGFGDKAISRMLDDKPKYQTVSKALALHDQMLSMELNEPYVFIDEPPEDYQKLRRHRNPKYRFEPLEGYQPPTI